MLSVDDDSVFVLVDLSLADLGGVPGARPQGSRFFRFNIHNFQNVSASGVHTPHYEVHGPYGKFWIRHCLLSVKGTKNRLLLVRLIFVFIPRCIPRFLRY